MNYDNETWEERSARINKANEELRQGWINIFIPSAIERAGIKIATFNKICLKFTDGRTIDLNEMTFSEIDKVHTEVARREDAKKAKVKREALKADGKCLRCGGAGQADQWAATGFTCYACNGTGITPMN